MNPDTFKNKKFTTKELYTKSLEYVAQNNRIMSSNYTEKKCERDLKKYLGIFSERSEKSNYYHFSDNLSDTIDDILRKNI